MPPPPVVQKEGHGSSSRVFHVTKILPWGQACFILSVTVGGVTGGTTQGLKDKPAWGYENTYPLGQDGPLAKLAPITFSRPKHAIVVPRSWPLA